ncbi:uncharacterized protein [Ambystoma mexicanum]|uniref:uncharacterized protein n=1 Tax=Ambystoma mexicanum TaxID=8296 RepID=UPI0037E80550
MEGQMPTGRKNKFVNPWEISAMPDAPQLNDGEDYHIFMSYSNTDSTWARGLIQELETAIRNLKACFHERNFLPGKTIVENMSIAIQRSQKVFLLLSRDFLQSRWCLMEADLSVFRERNHQKPVIPLMLEHCPIPLHLAHLTYLDTKDTDFFAKIVSVICNSSNSMENSSLVPYQPLSLYEGKPLLSLPAVNEHNSKKWGGTTFSANIPDALRMVFEDQAVYSEAIQMINQVSARSRKLTFLGTALAGFFVGLLSGLLLVGGIYAIECYKPEECSYRVFFGSILIVAAVTQIAAFLSLALHLKYVAVQGKLKEMAQAAGRANCLLVQNSILVGCVSVGKLLFLYVSLTKCRQRFAETFISEDGSLAEEMFQRALRTFSSDYTCAASQKHFPFPWPGLGEGHMEGGPCFCQYVSYSLAVRDNNSTCCPPLSNLILSNME